MELELGHTNFCLGLKRSYRMDVGVRVPSLFYAILVGGVNMVVGASKSCEDYSLFEVVGSEGL